MIDFFYKKTKKQKLKGLSFIKMMQPLMEKDQL